MNTSEMYTDILKHIFNTWVSLLQKLVKDHLSGGKFESMDVSQRFEAQYVVKHNKLADNSLADWTW